VGLDAGLTHAILSSGLLRSDVNDLLQIAALRFQKPPRKTLQTMAITDDLGNVKNLSLDVAARQAH
jgi:hypothetical protein